MRLCFFIVLWMMKKLRLEEAISCNLNISIGDRYFSPNSLCRVRFAANMESYGSTLAGSQNHNLT